MTKISVHYRNVKITPRKVRAVIDIVRGKRLTDSFDSLALVNKSAVEPVVKLIKSAKSAAEQKNLDLENVVISEIFANQGSALKRFHPRSKGRTSAYKLIPSNITLTLTDNKESR